MYFDDYEIEDANHTNQKSIFMMYQCNCLDNHKVIIWAKNACRNKHYGKSIVQLAKELPENLFNLRIIQRDKSNVDWGIHDQTMKIFGEKNVPFEDCVDLNKDQVLQVLELIEAKQVSKTNKHSNKCGKCGLVDEYASFSKKHNEVRCYRCY